MLDRGYLSSLRIYQDIHYAKKDVIRRRIDAYDPAEKLAAIDLQVGLQQVESPDKLSRFQERS